MGGGLFGLLDILEHLDLQKKKKLNRKLGQIVQVTLGKITIKASYYLPLVASSVSMSVTWSQ